MGQLNRNQDFMVPVFNSSTERLLPFPLDNGNAGSGDDIDKAQ